MKYDASIFEARGTTPKKRFAHLIRHLYRVRFPKFKVHNSEGLLYALVLLETLKYWQRRYTSFYIKVLDTLGAQAVIDLTKELLSVTVVTPQDLPLFFPTETSRTRLYAVNMEELYRVGLQEFFWEFSIYLGVIVHNLYKAWEVLPLFVVERPLVHFLYLRDVVGFPYRPKAQNLRLREVIPGFYYKRVREFYLLYSNVELLARFIGGKKRAKKYLRIIMKRTGIYTRKKQKWIK